MEFRILGPLEVADGDRTLPLGGGKRRALLAFLLLRRNRVVAVDEIVDALSPSITLTTPRIRVQISNPERLRLTDPKPRVGQEPNQSGVALPGGVGDGLDLGNGQEERLAPLGLRPGDSRCRVTGMRFSSTATVSAARSV